ncbi:MAG: MBL fold metallo-hydrolase [Candidatus Heimdallarchaeaceae archaeon]
MSINWDWIGEYFRVKVIFSVAGVATQILVCDTEEDSYVLLDVGDGILRDLLALPGRVYEKINIIAITHGHYDHVSGIYSLLSVFKLIERTNPLTLITPPNNLALKGLMQVFYDYCGGSPPYKINVIETNTKTVYFDSLSISPFTVKHRSSTIKSKESKSFPAVGYILKKKGEKILYTGDTGYFDKLKQYIDGVDLALIESTLVDERADYHLSIEEANNLGKKAKKYLLIHIPTHKYFKHIRKENSEDIDN